MSEYEYEDPGYDDSDDPYGLDEADLLGSLYESDPAAVEAMVSAAVESAVEPILAAQYGFEADRTAYIENRAAEQEALEEQAEAQALAEVAPVAERLIREAGDEHDVRESAANGRLGEYANELIEAAQYNAWASGDEELLASVSNAQAAEDAIALAAALLRDHAVKTRALGVIGSSRPGWDPVAKVWK